VSATSEARQAAALRKPSARTPVIVKVPTTRFLQIDGTGDIGSETHREAVTALYGLAYPVKFAARKKLHISYKVSELEGLYWHDGDSLAFNPADRRALAWTLMIAIPDEVTKEFVEEIRAKVVTKKDIPRIDDVRVQSFSEGKSVQIQHVGPYSEEGATIARLVAWAANGHFELTGRHHEIYLGDPNRGTAEKLKTIVRYPVRKAKS
jgi:hypothetical protein